MKARVSIKTIGGETVDHVRGSVSFTAEESDDTEAIARAMTEAIRGIGVTRKMLIVASVASKLGGYAAIEESTGPEEPFYNAALALVAHYEKNDREINEVANRLRK